MIEHYLLLGGRETGTELIVNERQLAPEPEMGLVVVINVGRACDRATFPIRREMPGAGLKQELPGFAQIGLLAVD